jgi:hypothetical protein
MATCGTEQPWVSSLLDGSQRAERCAAEAQSGQARRGLCSGGLPHLELLGVDGAGAVGVEEVEGLTDLLLLLLGEVRSGAALGARASTTVSLCASSSGRSVLVLSAARPTALSDAGAALARCCSDQRRIFGQRLGGWALRQRGASTAGCRGGLAHHFSKVVGGGRRSVVERDATSATNEGLKLTFHEKGPLSRRVCMILRIMDFFSNKKNFRIHSLASKGQYTLFGIDGIR